MIAHRRLERPAVVPVAVGVLALATAALVVVLGLAWRSGVPVPVGEVPRAADSSWADAAPSGRPERLPEPIAAPGGPGGAGGGSGQGGPAAAAASPQRPGEDRFAPDRRAMVDLQIRARGVSDEPVARAMEEVPRHLFVPEAERDRAYADDAVPVPGGPVLYQPYLVARMTSLLALEPEDRVLEIGTGTGYHTAVLARVAGEVYSIEIREELGREAQRRLERLGVDNAQVRIGDGYAGWPEKAPFDAILLNAAPPSIPQPLLDQLAVGGRMVAPVGDSFQDLLVVTKTADGLEKKKIEPVRLLPMDGEAQRRPR